MIFGSPRPDESVDQGDILDGCPLHSPVYWDLDRNPVVQLNEALARVVVLTQTCDLANEKTAWVVVAVALDAQKMVEDKDLTKAQIRDQVRPGRVWGWYFLPKSDEHNLPETIVDLRQLHTVRLDMLKALCLRGQRKARLQPLYREHLNQHFANGYARIGLPQPYPTENP